MMWCQKTPIRCPKETCYVPKRDLRCAQEAPIGASAHQPQLFVLFSYHELALKSRSCILHEERRRRRRRRRIQASTIDLLPVAAGRRMITTNLVRRRPMGSAAFQYKSVLQNFIQNPPAFLRVV
jgi:histone H3/H4